MKRIICFGDSNTAGYNPADGSRYKKEDRWTGILQSMLSSDHQIIEAGCNDRTCFINHPNGELYTGYKAIQSYLKEELYLVILAIGTNDIQKFYNPTSEEIKTGIINLINIIKKSYSNTKILLVSPPELNEDILKGNFSFQFDSKSIEKSKKFAMLYSEAAKENNCFYINLDKIAELSNEDGLHYLPSEHKKIAQKIYNFIISIA